MLKIFAHSLNQIGDQVIAPLELHIDLRKAIAYGISQPGQPVVDRNTESQRDGQQDQDDETCRQHAQATPIQIVIAGIADRVRATHPSRENPAIPVSHRQSSPLPLTR